MSLPAAAESAVATAAAVRAGATTALAETRAALARIAALDPQLGAFQLVRAERALAEAAEVDARLAAGEDLPLAGVPIAIKDNIPVAGEPMLEGSAATSAAPSLADHEVVARLRAAGAVVVGLTRVPELCVFGTTDSVHGTTRNPWNPTRTAGGSSGGSASAVASGMVAVAHAADGMGSIRIPAANCALVGLKPGAGLVPAEMGADSWFGMSENGPLATTVADAALLLAVMAGRPALADVAPPDRRLRIGLAPGIPTPLARLDPRWEAAARRTAATLAAAGHEVVELALPYPADPLPVLARWFAGAAADAAHLGLDDRLLEPRVRAHVRAGRVLERLGALRPGPVDRLRARVTVATADVDVVLTPALAQPGPDAEGWHRRGWIANLRSSIGYAPYAALWNLLGWPAAVVPAGWHPEAAVPLAVQLVARPAADGAGEALLLAVAAELELLAPWERTASPAASTVV
ncbi:amidase family protein [Yonghaparkia sp. Soil809]|uniref:amidase family protein n=1 Tax=Yonghaparkia sp. Soil809 TaxID=1736417 RepID=UPI0006F5BA9D|nr:amidase family protein [Yonghaparkia sp. Soil809]KRF32717.1 amidase [Yonghaparkia sp. Soil809]